MMLFSAPVLADAPPEAPARQKILILSSHGGYGHTAAAKTLESILKDRYDLKIIYPIQELRIFGSAAGEEFYNTLCAKGWLRSVNFIARTGAKLMRSRRTKIDQLIQKHIDKEKPALVISLIPFVNLPASEAARKKEVPYLMVTLDGDLRNWVHGFEAVSHPKFRATIGHDAPTTRRLLTSKKIPNSCIETLGFPIRADFLQPKNREQLRIDYNIPQDKPVVLIMMGGNGGQSAYDYTKTIGKMPLSTHIIVCAGRNEKLAKQLKKIKLHKSNSITIMKFTDKVSDLMALSDLLITKPGPGSINEGLTMQLPMLVDHTGASLFWERANTDLVLSYKVGERIRDLRKIGPILKDYLHNPQTRERIQKAYSEVPSNKFNERIAPLVDTMIQAGGKFF